MDPQASFAVVVLDDERFAPPHERNGVTVYPPSNRFVGIPIRLTHEHTPPIGIRVGSVAPFDEEYLAAIAEETGDVRVVDARSSYSWCFKIVRTGCDGTMKYAGAYER